MITPGRKKVKAEALASAMTDHLRRRGIGCRGIQTGTHERRFFRAHHQRDDGGQRLSKRESVGRTRVISREVPKTFGEGGSRRGQSEPNALNDFDPTGRRHRGENTGVHGRRPLKAI